MPGGPFCASRQGRAQPDQTGRAAAAKIEAKIEDVKEGVQQTADDLRPRIKALQDQLSQKLQGR